MSADLLRAAASLMRERAEAATPGPWEVPESIHGDPFIVQKGRGFLTGLIGRASGEDYGKGNSEHIASWHPAVALAVADWLDDVALFVEAKGDEDYFDLDGDPIAPEDTAAIGSALAVARVYLGAVA